MPHGNLYSIILRLIFDRSWTFLKTARYGFRGLLAVVIGGKDVTTNFLLGLPVSKETMLVLMLFAYFFLGFFMEWIGIIPILVPLFAPVVKALGFDPIWFGICACLTMQTSFLTPPMAPSLFYMKAVAPPEVDFVLHIIRGVVPFIFLQLLGLALIVIFPGFVTWLPNYLFMK